MANDPAPTKVVVDTNDDPGVAGDGQISFQEYFVRHRHSIPVRNFALVRLPPSQRMRRLKH